MRIIGLVLILFGSIWILQGVNVLPGSFMTGHPKWAVYGGGVALAGMMVFVIGSRRSRARREPITRRREET